MSEKIFTIVVTYNGGKWIRKCIESVYQESSVIVIDNNSNDQTTDIINEYFPEVHLICQKENLGFGGANNLGIQIALQKGAEYIFLLNQDAWLVEGNMTNMIAGFDKSTGIISPIHYSGNEGVLDVWFEGYLSQTNLAKWKSASLEEFVEVDFVNAAAWLMKSELLLEIGGFHPAFYHYGEDREFVQRMNYHGGEVRISSSCCICHDRPQDRSKNEYFTPLESVKRKMLFGLLNPGKSLENRKKQMDTWLLKKMMTSILKLKFSRLTMLIEVKKYLNERFVYCKSNGVPFFDDIPERVTQ